MKSLYKLILSTNIKSPALAFPLIMPLIFILLYSVGMPDALSVDQANAQVAIYFTTSLSIVTMQSGLMGFGINFIALKKSVLLKRIGATELTKTGVVMAVLFYGLTLWVISFIWITAMIILFCGMGLFVSAAGTGIVNGVLVNTTASSKATLLGWMGHIQWLKLAVSTLVMLYASYTLGLFFTSVAKDDQAYMGMAMLYFFFAGFIGGLMFPGEMPTWMVDFGYIVPHSYVGNFYDWAAGQEVSIWGLGQNATLAVSAAIPVAFGTVALVGAVKLLKFD